MNKEPQNIEVDQLLDAVFTACGYDFRDYARASIERRIRQFLSTTGILTIPELTARVVTDPIICSQLVRTFSVPVTSFFRDPFVYRKLREYVIPRLRTYPFIKIWHAGCASGEEAYSLAIMLKEEKLYDRATIFVTDFNDTALQKAKHGVYSIQSMRDATKSYCVAGGDESFSCYYHVRYDTAVIDSSLRKNMMFANYNLVTDGVFGDMHLILCRNVLIYFNRQLQNRVLDLFCQSVVRGGFLCLGTKETVHFSSVNNAFESLDEKTKIYKKIL